jgi:hypothetical protein
MSQVLNDRDEISQKQLGTIEPGIKVFLEKEDLLPLNSMVIMQSMLCSLTLELQMVISMMSYSRNEVMKNTLKICLRE